MGVFIDESWFVLWPHWTTGWAARKRPRRIPKNKAWKRGDQESGSWSVELEDPRPIFEGSPALYGYVLGIPEGGSGTDIYYDNIKITPNKK